MAESISQLEAKDFDEAMAHLSLVFNVPDFAGMLPALYQRTDAHMRCNLAVRKHGRIAAIVGHFPINLRVGGEALRIAGVGGVSVHPDHRGQGLMRMLMDEVMRQIASAGYHAAYLGGNRRHYAYWGFEKAGVEASFTVTPNSIAHSLPPNADAGFRLTNHDEGTERSMRRLYERQVIHCDRPNQVFFRHLRHWGRTAAVVLDDSGGTAGYCCLDSKDSSCVECCFGSDGAIDAFLTAQLRTNPVALKLTLPLLNSATLNRIAGLSDDVSIIEASNWRIYDWPRVVGALLRAKHSTDSLSDGTCVLKASDLEHSLRLTVDGSSASCEASQDPPDAEFNQSDLLRLLTGPVPVPVPRNASDLLRWRPLPLAIPMQDRV